MLTRAGAGSNLTRRRWPHRRHASRLPTSGATIVNEPFGGIYVIAQTPFGADSATILWDEFQREVDWIVRAGAHGFVWPVMASEYTAHSTAERVQGMRLAIDAVAGRVPVIICVADTCQPGAA